MNTYAYYRHTTSGDVWAVSANNHGMVEKSCGPLHYTEITQVNLDTINFDWTDEDAGWMNEQTDHFRLVNPSEYYDDNLSSAAAALGRKGGQSTSDAKAAAARANGKRGGRPPKQS